MTQFGWDASDYDWARGPMDLGAAARAGIAWFTHKATEATSVRHTHFGDAMNRAQAAGIPLLGAYHVVRSPANAAAEVDYCLAYVNAAAPWWRDHPGWFWQVDLERWPYDAVPASEGEQFADIIEARTGRKAIIYASRGQYGDALSGTSHELWNANYPSSRAGDFRSLYPGDSGPGWTSYSGRMPVFWQYTDNATIGRQPGCDANAFRGSLDQLRALLAPSSTRPTATTKGKRMLIAHEKGDNNDYVGDGVTRRWIKSPDDFRNVQAIMTAQGYSGDQLKSAEFWPGTIFSLGEMVGPDPHSDTVSEQVAALTAAIQALSAGGTSIDTAAVISHIDQVAAALRGKLATAARAEADSLAQQ